MFHKGRRNLVDACSSVANVASMRCSWLMALALFACDELRTPTVGTASSQPSTTSVVSAPTAATEAPSSPPDVAVTVIVSKNEIRLGDDDAPVVALSGYDALAKGGIDVRHKRKGEADLFIVPLGSRLEAVRLALGGDAPHDAIVIADPQTPYRVLVEVLYTLGQVAFSKYHLMVMKPTGDDVGSSPPLKKVGELPNLARVVPFPARAADSLDLTVIISSGGYALKTSAGGVAPGCRGLGGGISIPRSAGLYDADGLARCAQRLKRIAPDETQVTIVAENAIPYWLVVETVDVLRGARRPSQAHEPIRQLFPDAHFAPAR